MAGARTYLLDVDDAMAQFRRTIQEQISTLLSNRLDEINRACEMDWTPNDLWDLFFQQPLPSEDKIPDFSEYLSRAIDDFIDFISGCGGLKKYLPQDQ